MTFYKATDLAQVCTQGHRDTDVLERVCAHTDTHISKDTQSKTKIKECKGQTIKPIKHTLGNRPSKDTPHPHGSPDPVEQVPQSTATPGHVAEGLTETCSCAPAYRHRLDSAHHRGSCPTLNSLFGSWCLLTLGLPLLSFAVSLHKGTLHLGNDV